jgi:Uncharacterized conserved protein
MNWYQQRISVEKNRQAKAIMKNAQKEEFKHFGMGLEFIMRQIPDLRETLKGILFTTAISLKQARKRRKPLTDPLPSRDEALAIVHEYTASDSLRKHMLSVEAAMRAYAAHFGEDVERWGLTVSFTTSTTKDFPMKRTQRQKSTLPKECES